MKFVSPQMHALLDFLSWWVFLLAPRHFDPGAPATASVGCYVTAFLGFAVCMLTRYPLGLMPVMSFRTHGRLELAYVPLMLAWPWIAGFAEYEVARGFFIATGLALLLLCIATDYDAAR